MSRGILVAVGVAILIVAGIIGWRNFGGDVQDATQGAVEAAIDTAGEASDALTDTAGALGGAAQDLAEDAADAASDMASDMASDAADTITDAAGDVTDMAADAMNTLMGEVEGLPEGYDMTVFEGLDASTVTELVEQQIASGILPEGALETILEALNLN